VRAAQAALALLDRRLRER